MKFEYFFFNLEIKELRNLRKKNTTVDGNFELLFYF